MPLKTKSKLAILLSLASLVAITISIIIFTLNNRQRKNEQTNCAVNIMSIQKSVRSMQGIDNLVFGVSLTWNTFVGPDKPMDTIPTCPSGGTYTLLKTIPPPGTPACSCDHPEHQTPKEKTLGW